MWTLQVPVSKIIADSASEIFACILDHQILIFESFSSSPQERISTSAEISSLCFVEADGRSLPLLLDSSTQLSLHGFKQSPESSQTPLVSAIEAHAFSSLFRSQKSEAANSSGLVVPQLAATTLTTASVAFLQPSHVALPADRLLKGFLSQLLPGSLVTGDASAMDSSTLMQTNFAAVSFSSRDSFLSLLADVSVDHSNASWASADLFA